MFVKSFFVLISLLFFNFSAISSNKDICGEVDDRAISFEKSIGRTSSKREVAGCTVTMISPRCAIGAGHCVDDMEVVQFNVPTSNSSGPVISKPEDIYLRNKDFLRYSDKGKGDDWAVILLNPNEITGKEPGLMQGVFEISFNKLELQQKIKVVGFGVNEQDSRLHLSQQESVGVIKKVGGGIFGKKSLIGHDADTAIGSSGAPIISQDNKIIGIHAFGTCGDKGYNQGTIISLNKNLMYAIKQCLDFESQNQR